jgi:addiction module HigA family antidote
MKNPNHPGDIIRDCLDELGVSVTDGAKALGVAHATLSRLINGKAGVSAEMAVRLEKAIGSTAGFWASLATQLRPCAGSGAKQENSRPPPRRWSAACVLNPRRVSWVPVQAT